MLELIGVDGLTQWDVGRQINVDKDVDMVHFSNRPYGYSKNVKVTDGVADVPDMFLTSCAPLRVWAYVGDFEKGYTKIEKIYEVKPKNRPEDYIYTPEEIKTWEKLQSEIGDLSELKTEAKENLVAAINEVAASGGADWNQNNPTAKDYVKNRTHYRSVREETATAEAGKEITLTNAIPFDSGEVVNITVNGDKKSLVAASDVLPDVGVTVAYVGAPLSSITSGAAMAYGWSVFWGNDVWSAIAFDKDYTCGYMTYAYTRLPM